MLFDLCTRKNRQASCISYFPTSPYIKRKADLDDRLYKMYDKIEDTENLLIAARAKKMSIEAEKLTGDNIYKVLIYFDKLYAVMNEQE